LIGGKIPNSPRGSTTRVPGMLVFDVELFELE
jgi:hypothetical protein